MIVVTNHENTSGALQIKILFCFTLTIDRMLFISENVPEPYSYYIMYPAGKEIT